MMAGRVPRPAWLSPSPRKRAAPHAARRTGNVGFTSRRVWRVYAVAELEGYDWELEWEFLVAEAWADADLMARLLERPADVLAERGFALPEGAGIEVAGEGDGARFRITDA